MNKSRQIEGRWWINGDDKPFHLGTLSFDPEKGLELKVNVPQDRPGGASAFFAMFDEISRDEGEVPQIIHGTDENGRPITLFGCGNFSRSWALVQHTYHLRGIGGAVLNFRAGSTDERPFVFANARYTLLQKWMGRRLGIKHTVAEDGLVGIQFKSHELLELRLSNGVVIRIFGTMLREGYNLLDELRIGWSHSVSFLFPAPLSPKAIHDDFASIFLRLLWLLTGAQVHIENLSFHDHDAFAPGSQGSAEGAELLCANYGISEATRDLHPVEMIASFPEIEADFGSILNRWFECQEQLKPVLDLYFAVLANKTLEPAARFLFLAQAIEVYHARSREFSPNEKPEAEHKQRLKVILESAPSEYRGWLALILKYSNRKTLAQRLEDILARHASEAEKLNAKIEAFSDTFRDSRNYYTHYDEKLLQRGKVAVGLNLVRLATTVEALLQVCLLKEIGIQGKPIERILERNASINYVES